MFRYRMSVDPYFINPKHRYRVYEEISFVDALNDAIQKLEELITLNKKTKLQFIQFDDQ